jgi:DNA repair exonuclease SbcCD nuclease subunit
MKFLLTGDLHLDAITAGCPRMAEVEEAFGQVVSRVHAERIYAVVFMGDLCNPDRGARTLRSVNAAIEMFKSLVSSTGCAVVALAGNHDVVHDGSGLTSLSPLRAAFGGRAPDPGDPEGGGVRSRSTPRAPRTALGAPGGGPDPSGCPVPAYLLTPGVVGVSERPLLLELSGDGERVHVLTLPFTSSASPYDPPSTVTAVARWREGRGETCPLVVAGHLQITGAALGSETCDMARGRDVEWPVAACNEAGASLIVGGHYHKRQCVNGVEFPGSLVRLSFGEEDNTPQWLEATV